MFGGDHKARIERLESLIVAMAANQRQFFASLKALVQNVNASADATNGNFADMFAALAEISDRLEKYQADDEAENWWRNPRDSPQD